MPPLSTISGLIIESLSYPGASALGIFAMMAGAAALAEINRVNLHTTAFYWTITPILWGVILFAETGSLLLASIGALTLWFFPGLGFVLVSIVFLILSADAYHQIFTPA